MNRFSRLGSLLRVALNAAHTPTSLVNGSAEASNAIPAVISHLKNFHSGKPTFSAPTNTSVDTLLKEYEHVTGAEKEELEAELKGGGYEWESWLQQPFGTPDNPVVVPSEYASRIVGVPDPDDDSLLWWGIIEDGQPPKQIIEGGEYFVLKKLPSSGSHH